MTINYLDPKIYGPGKTGPQNDYLLWRLVLHLGIPAEDWSDALRAWIREFQLKQGWTGTGADGFVGPETLRRLAADPKVTLPAVRYPSDILDLDLFKLTLPDGTQVTGLKDYRSAWFDVNPERDGVVFRSPVGGGRTTPNTKYLRSELRELARDGSLAKWSNRSEVHALRSTLAVTELPKGKPEVVCGQIHDDKDDVLEILASGPELYASWSKGKGKGSDKILLDPNFKLDEVFDIYIDADPDGVEVRYNKQGFSKSYFREDLIVSNAYWKMGCYVQAYAGQTGKYRGKEFVVPENTAGEVVVYDLEVTEG